MTRQPLRGAGFKRTIVFWFYQVAVYAARWALWGLEWVGAGGELNACLLWAHACCNNYRIELIIATNTQDVKISREALYASTVDEKSDASMPPVWPSFNGSSEHTCRTSYVKVLNFFVRRCESPVRKRRKNK